MQFKEILQNIVDIYKEEYTDLIKYLRMKSYDIRFRILMSKTLYKYFELKSYLRKKYWKLTCFILKPYIENKLKMFCDLPAKMIVNNINMRVNFKYDNINKKMCAYFILDDLDLKPLNQIILKDNTLDLTTPDDFIKSFYDSIGHLFIRKSLYRLNIDKNVKHPVCYYEIPKENDNSLSFNRTMYIFNYDLIFNVTN